MGKMDSEYRPAFVTLACTGMRIRSEFLRCSLVNLRDRKVHIPGTKTLSSDDIIPVSNHLWHYVQAAIPCRHRYWKLREVWRAACHEADIHPIPTIHDLRHCFGMWLIAAGRSLPSVQASMRHDDISTTGRYLATAMKQEDADALGRLIGRR